MLPVEDRIWCSEKVEVQGTLVVEILVLSVAESLPCGPLSQAPVRRQRQSRGFDCQVFDIPSHMTSRATFF